MRINKKAVIVLSAAAVMLAASAGVIKAASLNEGGNNKMSGLVSAIAQKFNLNTGDVQKVFDDTMAQQRADMQAKKQQQFTDRISQAVKDGKLTQSEADKIIVKEQEVQNFMASLSGKSAADRQSAIKSEMDSLKQWATDNNIPQQYLPFAFGGRGGEGFGLMGGKSATFGTVTAINGINITLQGKNNTIYTIDASQATVTKLITGTDGKPAKSAISVSDIKAGDTLTVQGTVSGTNIAAVSILDGNFQQEGHMDKMMFKGRKSN